MTAYAPPISEYLMTIDVAGQPTLNGARHRETGRIVFPPPDDLEEFEVVSLPREGTLWSWTVQRFRPKSPPYAGAEAFAPYAVGYVTLGDAIIVEARLTGAPLDSHEIGAAMTLVAEPFEMSDGTLRTTFAFAPTETAA